MAASPPNSLSHLLVGWFRGWSWRRKSELIVPGGSSEHGDICVGSQATSYPRNKPLRKHIRFGHPQSLYFQGKSHTTFILFVEVRRTPIVKVGCCRVGRLVQPRPEMEPQRKCDVVQRVDEDSAGLAPVQKPSNRGLSEEKLVYLPPKGFFNRSCRFFDLKKKLWGVPVEAKIDSFATS